MAMDDDALAKGTHEGFKWCVLHNGIGHRCGYICIPKGHPWHEKLYDDIPNEHIHGGLTFSSEIDGEYWIGFDCAHCWDAPDPSLYPKADNRNHGEIRETPYVQMHCLRLCNQAKAAATAVQEIKANP